MRVLLAAVWLFTYFGRVRLQHAGKFSDQKRRSFDPISSS
jgi:hypothetical protein